MAANQDQSAAAKHLRKEMELIFSFYCRFNCFFCVSLHILRHGIARHAEADELAIENLVHSNGHWRYYVRSKRHVVEWALAPWRSVKMIRRRMGIGAMAFNQNDTSSNKHWRHAVWSKRPVVEWTNGSIKI